MLVRVSSEASRIVSFVTPLDEAMTIAQSCAVSLAGGTSCSYSTRPENGK